MSGNTEPSKPGTLRSILKLAATIGESVVSVRTAIVAIGAIITGISTFVSVAFGSGSVALEEAIKTEHGARGVVHSAQKDSAAAMVEYICEEIPDSCATEWQKDQIRSGIRDSFRIGTAVTVAEEMIKVHSLADLPEADPFKLQSDLRIAISLAISGSLPVQFDTAHTAVADYSGYFGAEPRYANLVWDWIVAQVRCEALKATPELVEKPAWWRDWLLGGGAALGGIMVGGVIGAWLWSLGRRTGG